jgi:hypothetical protein
MSIIRFNENGTRKWQSPAIIDYDLGSGRSIHELLKGPDGDLITAFSDQTRGPTVVRLSRETGQIVCQGAAPFDFMTAGEEGVFTSTANTILRWSAQCVPSVFYTDALNNFLVTKGVYNGVLLARDRTGMGNLNVNRNGFVADHDSAGHF